MLDVAGFYDVGVLCPVDEDADVEAAVLLATPDDEVELLTTAEVDVSPLDELVQDAHSSINPAAATPANARRGRAIITAPHWA